MPPSPSETAFDDFLTFLLPHSVHTVQNALMEALSQWLNGYYPAKTARPLRAQAIVEYEGWVGKTITAEHYNRRTLPPHTPLPTMHADMQIVQLFAQKVIAFLRGMPVEEGIRLLGSLNGAWILSCPKVIVHNAPEFATSIATATTEADLIWLLIRQLSLYLY